MRRLVASVALTLCLATAAWAVPKGYTEVAQDHDCQLLRGPEKASGVAPVRAECEWTDRSLEQLDAALSQPAAWSQMFSGLTTSRVVEQGDGATRMLWVHSAKGLSDRVHHVLVTRNALGNGTVVHGWSMTEEQPEPGDGRLVPAADTGRWELTAIPSGGVKVVFERQYEPGGKIPGLVMRWLKTEAVFTQLSELRRWQERPQTWDSVLTDD